MPISLTEWGKPASKSVATKSKICGSNKTTCLGFLLQILPMEKSPVWTRPIVPISISSIVLITVLSAAHTEHTYELTLGNTRDHRTVGASKYCRQRKLCHYTYVYTARRTSKRPPEPSWIHLYRNTTRSGSEAAAFSPAPSFTRWDPLGWRGTSANLRDLMTPRRRERRLGKTTYRL